MRNKFDENANTIARLSRLRKSRRRREEQRRSAVKGVRGASIRPNISYIFSRTYCCAAYCELMCVVGATERPELVSIETTSSSLINKHNRKAERRRRERARATKEDSDTLTARAEEFTLGIAARISRRERNGERRRKQSSGQRDRARVRLGR